jgi:DNA-directed RNA polymerase specialized sigma24 family protein
MLVAGRWDGSDGLPVEISSRWMGVNRKAPAMSRSARWATRRRAALILQKAGFTRVETAIALGVSPEAVKKSLQRTRRLRDEVLRDAG